MRPALAVAHSASAWRLWPVLTASESESFIPDTDLLRRLRASVGPLRHRRVRIRLMIFSGRDDAAGPFERPPGRTTFMGCGCASGIEFTAYRPSLLRTLESGLPFGSWCRLRMPSFCCVPSVTFAASAMLVWSSADAIAFAPKPADLARGNVFSSMPTRRSPLHGAFEFHHPAVEGTRRFFRLPAPCSELLFPAVMLSDNRPENFEVRSLLDGT